MPSPREHQAKQIVKLLLIGNAKTGKTTSLWSLVQAGYWLGIMDFDNLTDPLVTKVMKLGDKADNVDIVPIRDNYKSSSIGPVIDGVPQAWTRAVKLLDRWKYTHNGVEIDHGVPSQWGPNKILVIDSLTRMCDAAFDYHEAVDKNPDKRATYGSAQKAVNKCLSMLTSDRFNTNLIVIGHGNYMTVENKTMIFPEGIGKALSPLIPQYFPNYVKYELTGGKRTIQLDSDNTISLANGNPDVLKGTLDANDGLAKFFNALREPPKPSKPETLTLKRIA